MAPEWKRSVAEALLQALGVDKEFQATLNTRNERMMGDASKFCKHIVRLETDINGIQRKMEEKFENLGAMLNAPMPRVWDYTSTTDDTVEALSPEGCLGEGVDVTALIGAQREMRVKLEDEVLSPMRAWIKAFEQAATQMKKLEVQRLILDNRRRTVGDLDHQLSMMHEKSMRATPAQNGLHTSGQAGPYGDAGAYDPKTARLIEEKSKKKAHKEGKLNKSQAQFQELEQIVYNSLKTLIEDADQFKVYAHAALVEMSTCFAAACSVFENPGATGASMEFSSTAGREGADGAAAPPTAPPRSGSSRILSGMFSKLSMLGAGGAPAAGGTGRGGGGARAYDSGAGRHADQVERFDAAGAGMAPAGKIAPPPSPGRAAGRPSQGAGAAVATGYYEPAAATSPPPNAHRHAGSQGWGC
ncbi:hypothetical protein FOA52_009182 [Chlamydomonas sp. UWO 241]|nr:hypothetical protein FOA52_009182 [Chlamydomonas sp. UWO 241]